MTRKLTEKDWMDAIDEKHGLSIEYEYGHSWSYNVIDGIVNFALLIGGFSLICWLLRGMPL